MVSKPQSVTCNWSAKADWGLEKKLVCYWYLMTLSNAWGILGMNKGRALCSFLFKLPFTLESVTFDSGCNFWEKLKNTMTLRGKETSIRISNINRGNWECSIMSSKWQSIETRWLQLSFASTHKNIWFLECISCFTSFWAAVSYSFLVLPPLIHSPNERLKSVCSPWLLMPVICQEIESYK